MKNQNNKEEKNKKRGMFFTFFLHGSLVLLALIPFLTGNPLDPMKEKKQVDKAKAIMINFAPSKAKTPSKAKASEAPPKTEELKPIPVKPTRPKPVAQPKPVPRPSPKPAAAPTPKPRPTPRPTPRPVVTAPTPTPPAPAPSPQPAASPSPSPVANPAPAASPQPAASTTASANTPANGTVGDGKTPSDNTTGDDGEDDGGDGIFGRQVIYRPNIKNLTKKNGKIQVEMCVNRDGKVVSTRYVEDGSNMDDDDLIHATQVAAKKYKFEKDYEAPGKQCGKLTFIFSID